MLGRPMRYAMIAIVVSMGVVVDMKRNVAGADEPFIGQIQMFGFGFAPRGWTFCDGQLLPIASNTSLFSLLGTTFGGDGRTTFGLPDLRGRVAIHPGTGPGLSNIKWGQKGGQERVTLSISEIPSHNHSIGHDHTGNVNANSSDGDVKLPANATMAVAKGRIYISTAPDVQMAADSLSIITHTGNSGDTGGGAPHNNVQPFLGIVHAIARTGIYPSRN